MTDEEIVKECAEKVMKWATRTTRVGVVIATDACDNRLCLSGNSTLRRWNPLISDDDAFEMVDALLLTIDGFKLRKNRAQWVATFDGHHGASGLGRRRAIVFAALLAVDARVS